MDRQSGNTEFDAIVVGSGPAGSTIARELSKSNKRVLILERGGNGPLKEGLGMAGILSKVSASDNLAAVRAFTTGGTTAFYFAVADFPPLETFQALGIDLSGALDEAKRELPLAILPDEVYGAQAMRLRDSAITLGYPWKKATMLIDLSKCQSGYTYEAKWNARSYLREAVADGAILLTRAQVQKVLVEKNRAIGVEYKVPNEKKEVEVRRAYATKIILAAGGAASPIILRDSGVKNVANRGFYCHPGFAMFGTILGLKAGDNYVGSMGAALEDGLGMGDGNPARVFYRMLMLGNGRWIRAMFHSRSIGVGVMIKEGLGGGLQEDGRYYKQLEKADLDKLQKGEEMARQLLRHAGGKNIVKLALSAGHIGGAIRIKEYVDENLETEYRNLHVCDGSVIPESVKVTPTLTLVCLGKYLAGRLVPSL